MPHGPGGARAHVSWLLAAGAGADDCPATADDVCSGQCSLHARHLGCPPRHAPLTHDQAVARLAERITERELTGIHCYGMRLRGNDEIFGYCGLVTGRTGLDEPEIAYELLPRMHNFGYATEAAQAVISAARATGRRRLWSTVRAWNIASLRVLEKNAFVRDHSRWDKDGEIVYLRYELQGQRQPSD